jgi:hypothetical protein
VVTDHIRLDCSSAPSTTQAQCGTMTRITTRTAGTLTHACRNQRPPRRSVSAITLARNKRYRD